MRILVTGAAGKIGSRVVPELAKHGHTVLALDRRPMPAEVRSTAEVLYADLTDSLAILNAAQGCDAIAHLGAIPQPYVPADQLLQLNVIGTQNVLEAARAENISKVVLTSSVGALGFSFPTHPCLPDYLPIDTQHPRRPQDIYGLSKLMNEESAAAMTRLCGMTTIVIRPPAVWDLERAKQQGWLKRTLERHGEDRDTSLWGYIDVYDQAIAFRLALESRLTGHYVFYTMVDDLGVNATVAELTERHFPQLLPYLDCLTGNTFYDLAPAREQLGFVAERTWRKVLEEGTDLK
ncbi:MAG: NAD-dependent epimerase/dehydratase family protein [Janthinobacterium lividum]